MPRGSPGRRGPSLATLRNLTISVQPAGGTATSPSFSPTRKSSWLVSYFFQRIPSYLEIREQTAARDTWHELYHLVSPSIDIAQASGIRRTQQLDGERTD